MAFTSAEIRENYYEEINDKIKMMGGNDLSDDDCDVYDPPEAGCGIDIFINERRGFHDESSSM